MSVEFKPLLGDQAKKECERLKKYTAGVPRKYVYQEEKPRNATYGYWRAVKGWKAFDNREFKMKFEDFDSQKECLIWLRGE